MEYLIDRVVSHIETSQSGFNTFECIGINRMKFIPSNIEILEGAKTCPVIRLDLEKGGTELNARGEKPST